MSKKANAILMICIWGYLLLPSTMIFFLIRYSSQMPLIGLFLLEVLFSLFLKV